MLRFRQWVQFSYYSFLGNNHNVTHESGSEVHLYTCIIFAMVYALGAPARLDIFTISNGPGTRSDIP